ncbi:dTDP-3-amino-3,6-dideoxy-alpha-D-galactopyranose transaminase [Variovorax sp. SRS16]|uniref:DegT/DnrJ/EryC1/StrS family aminotransferase n=1 Tax=Variovorax sp. SRS16 TaxID=282217 RepID=UPI001315B649|nr:DegT/DnrJ/EryC1/StrS family aminotransferase [Variovorax sp. SRS16]VTU13739.1 dTDP-3-amino-3,6-dideoxy-alpha-D-galactopyranose transaminase [Variovorax sp. SRS16]
MIPLFSAKAANAGLDLESVLLRVLRSNWYVLGAEVTAFEQEFAAHAGAAECVSLANGTDALELALRAVDVAAGDHVACVANAGFYGSTAIHAIGAKPLYVDIDAKTLNMSAAAFERAIQQGPKAVIVTHLYGQMADIEALAAMASKAGIKLIEDCAQSHGAMRNGHRAGSIGDIGCFSFYPTKNLGALGDGGAVVCNDPAIAKAVRTLRQYGWSTKYHVSTPHGRNSRLDEVQAAVLRAKLPHLDAANNERRQIAARYNAAFADLPLGLPPSTQEDYVGHLYVVRIDGRDAFREHLRSRDVATDVHYPLADHLQTAYPGAQVSGTLEQTERACDTVVSLPCFPGLADSEVTQVIDAVRAFFAH